jgi:hypothetical protein
MSMKDLVAEACEPIATVAPKDAGKGLILDVRELGELEGKGRVLDALHVPRGLP